MVFQFEHISQAWDPVYGKWAPKPFDLVALKRVFNRWQAALQDDGWNSLFWGNHDLPRAVSKYGDGSEASARMLAVVLHLMKGTPYIYQGEEIGMTNAAFTRIEQFRDVETLNFYAIEIAKGMDPQAFIQGANANGRDNARTPMQWTAGPEAGFTTGTPWIEVNPNHSQINAAAAQAKPDGVFATYKTLAALRKAHPIIVHGSYAPLLEHHTKVVAYLRKHQGQCLAVIANFTGDTVSVDPNLTLKGESLIATHSARTALNGPLTLAAHEAFAILG
jgi:oligo-1,6-glucosidase